MLAYLLKVLICSGTLYILYHFLLRKETFFGLNRLFLLSVIGVSIIIPFLHISLNFNSPEGSFIQAFINGTKELFLVVWLDEVIILAKAPRTFGWIEALETTYLIGICVFSFRIFLFIYRIIRLRLKSRTFHLGKIQLNVHDQPFSAFSVGNSVYVNQSEFNKNNFKIIWKHELTHIQLGHTLESFILEVICCIFWFNPFIWAIKSRLKEIHEYQVDAQLIKKGINSITYQKHLVNYVFDENILSEGSHFGATDIKKRIQMLISPKASWKNKIKLLLSVPVLFILTSAFAFNGYNTQTTPIFTKQPVYKSLNTNNNNTVDSIPKKTNKKI